MKNLNYFYSNEEGRVAAEIFADEIEARMKKRPQSVESKDAGILFTAGLKDYGEGFAVSVFDDRVVFSASSRRGFIYCVGLFLRKAVLSCRELTLSEDISGEYCPQKKVRGHQLGYRTTSNCYESWDYEQYRQYCKELMFFGSNTVEHIPYENGVSKRNKLMKYDEEDFIVEASKMADEFDLDVSLWQPNCPESVSVAVSRRKKLYSRIPRIDAVFPPGGDPGNIDAPELIDRCKRFDKVLKSSHPSAGIWPSAQVPDGFENWREKFIDELNKEPDEIAGIVFGPNKAYELDELRRKVPAKYPVRFYPDIAHNVRCEYPVHFDTLDWHYSLNTALCRECTNPRPNEYARLHKKMAPYTIGSVSYSEGINDDVNKAVFAALDFDSDTSVYEIILDYCRLFFFGKNFRKIADLIFGLELNWIGDPVCNPSIDSVYSSFTELSEDAELMANWRFLQLYFRAVCDKFVKEKRMLHLKNIKDAYKCVLNDNLVEAKRILSSDYSRKIKELRTLINKLAKQLNNLIGLQLDVKHYCADNWERGAVLDTIDLPLTDREWLLSKIENCSDSLEALKYFKRNTVDSDEFFYSVAFDGLKDCGYSQTGEIYMNFQGDRPNVNDGTLPTALFNVYDNFSFKCKVGGLTADCDYKIIITFLDRKNDESDSLTIMADEHVVYKGKMFGETDSDFNNDFLKEGFITGVYHLPSKFITNGCVDLTFSEDSMGVMFAEFRVVKEK